MLDAQRGARLRAERARLGLSQEALAEAVGVRREQWVKYESGAEPGASVLARAAEAGVNVLHVLTGRLELQRRLALGGFEMEQQRSGVLSEPEQLVYGATLRYVQGSRSLEFCLVPRYDIRASGGNGSDNGQFDDLPVGEIAFESVWMRQTFGRAGAGFVLATVTGRSMEPSYWDRSIVLVDLRAREVVDGEVFMLRDGDELLIKRLQRLMGGKVEVVSDNKAFRSEVVDDPERLSVIGRVVWPRVQ